MLKNAKIFVAGHNGLVGSAIVARLLREGYSGLLLCPHDVLDLCRGAAVSAFFDKYKPEYVIMAAGLVGGISANMSRPADFVYQNAQMALNVISASHQHSVKRLLYLGSSCIYPRMSPQPIKEEYLLTGALEPTNQPYALAKLLGVELCNGYRKQFDCDFFSAMPCNLYGPRDNFATDVSHVLPAMIRKFYQAKQAGEKAVVLWGTGKPMREFLYVDDLADAVLFLMNHPKQILGHINIGTGREVSIEELAAHVKALIHPDSHIVWDTSMPDGTPRKKLDVSKLKKLGWQASTPLTQGIRTTYDWFCQNAKRRD